MSRPTTKTELIAAAAQSYEELLSFIDTLTPQELSTPFDFSDTKKKEAHWARDKNLRDVLTHLYEWHRLLLTWVDSNQSGVSRPFLPLPYNWKTYGQMNQGFWQAHQSTSLQTAKELFTASHRDTMSLLASLSESELFTPGAFPWCPKSPLASFFAANTSSHYAWALKKLKAHCRCLKTKS